MKNWLQRHPLILWTITVSLPLVSQGMAVSWPNYATRTLKNHYFTMTDTQAKWIVTTHQIGALIGSIFVAVLPDRFGRVKTIQFFTFLEALAWLMLIYPQNYLQVIIARCIDGVNNSVVCTVTPVYLAEVAVAKWRGAMDNTTIFALAFGLFLINLLGGHVPLCVFGIIGSILALMSAVAMFYMPESPYYFLLKGKTTQAKVTLLHLRKRASVTEEFNEKCKGIADQLAGHGTSLKDVLTDRVNWTTFFKVLVIFFANESSGANVFYAYGVTIFSELHSHVHPHFSSTLMGATNLLCCLLFFVLVDRVGRRLLLAWCGLACGTINILFSVYFYLDAHQLVNTTSYSWLPMLLLVLHIMYFTLGVGSVALIVNAEMFSTRFKYIGLCFVQISSSCFGLFSFEIYHIAQSPTQLYMAFWFYAFAAFIGALFGLFVLKETAGKTLEEIQHDLRN